MEEVSGEKYYWYCVNKHKDLMDKEVPPDELHLVFNFTPKNIEEFKVIRRKTFLYSTHSYFILPFRVSAFTTYIDPYTEEPVDRHYNVDKEYKIYWEESIKYDKYCTILPEKTDTPFTEFWDTRNMLNLKFKYTFLKYQLTENEMYNKNGVRLLLPHLLGKSDDEVLKVRTGEYNEQFHIFQSSLIRLLNNSKLGNNEREFYYLMQEVNDSVKELNDKLISLKKKKWYMVLGLTMIPLPLILTFSWTAEAIEYIKTAIGAIGGASIYQFIDQISKIKSQRNEIEKDPFFIPWYLSK